MMGARGPKKKPAKKDELEGNPSRRKRKPAAKRGAKPTAAALEVHVHVPVRILLVDPPPPPARLDGEAKQMWLKLSQLLTQAKVLTTADLEALSVLCDTWEEYLLAKQAGDRNPYFETENGYTVEHPAVRRMQHARDRLDKLWSRFGLTPVSRAGMDWEIAAVVAEDDPEAFAAGRG